MTTVKGTLEVFQDVTVNGNSRLIGNVQVGPNYLLEVNGAITVEGNIEAQQLDVAQIGTQQLTVNGNSRLIGNVQVGPNYLLEVNGAITVEGNIEAQQLDVARIETQQLNVARVAGPQIYVGQSDGKLGFFGATPIQRTRVYTLPPDMCVDYTACTNKINEIIQALQALGLIQ